MVRATGKTFAAAAALGLAAHVAVLGPCGAAQARAERQPLSQGAAEPDDTGAKELLAHTATAELVHAGASQRLHAARLLADDASAHGLTLLWLLAHDPSPEVQATALHATLLRCPQESRTVCAGLLRFFFDDGQADTSWEARTALLSDDPDAALQAATKAYKLEVISLLAGRVGRPQAPDGLWRALRVLAQDYEPEVQEAASIVLLDQQR